MTKAKASEAAARGSALPVRTKVKHCKHSTERLEYLSATLPNDCAFCAHEQIEALADALDWALTYGDFDVCVDNPLYAAQLDKARAVLRAAGTLP